jgi:hypothetical protein
MGANALTRICAVFGKTAVHGDTMSFKVLAEQFLTTAAIEAFTAELRVVGNDTVSELETLDLGSNSSNDTNSFMAYEWLRVFRRII